MQAIALGTLTRSESLTLLHRHRSDLAADDLGLDAIAAELGDLPLALHLAGSYLALGRHEAFGRPVFQVEASEPSRAIDVLADWLAVEEAVRYGAVVRVVSAERGLTESAVADRLAAAGLAASVRAVSPTVEDVFISFVDKERKARLRRQLGAF